MLNSEHPFSTLRWSHAIHSVRPRFPLKLSPVSGQGPQWPGKCCNGIAGHIPAGMLGLASGRLQFRAILFGIGTCSLTLPLLGAQIKVCHNCAIFLSKRV